MTDSRICFFLLINMVELQYFEYASKHSANNLSRKLRIHKIGKRRCAAAHNRISAASAIPAAQPQSHLCRNNAQWNIWTKSAVLQSAAWDTASTLKSHLYLTKHKVAIAIAAGTIEHPGSMLKDVHVQMFKMFKNYLNNFQQYHICHPGSYKTGFLF